MAHCLEKIGLAMAMTLSIKYIYIYTYIESLIRLEAVVGDRKGFSSRGNKIRLLLVSNFAATTTDEEVVRHRSETGKTSLRF